jgi:carboxypeptidase Taq
MQAATRDLGSELTAGFRAGDFAPLLGWLRQHVHAHGRKFRPGELCRRATGRPLSADAFLAYLREKLNAG